MKAYLQCILVSFICLLSFCLNSSAIVANNTGRQGVLAVLMQDSSSPNENALISTDEIEDRIFGTETMQVNGKNIISLSSYLNEVSRGNIEIFGEVLGLNDMPNFCARTSLGNGDVQAILSFLINNNPDTNFHQYNKFIFVINSNNQESRCIRGASGISTIGPINVTIPDPRRDGRNRRRRVSAIAIFANNILTATLEHEFGHTLGVQHSNALDCGEESIANNCTTPRLSNPYTPLGDSKKGQNHYFASRKEKLDWLNEENVIAFPDANNIQRTYTISPIENDNQEVQTVKVKQNLNSNTSQIYYIEFRRRTGTSANVDEDINFDGALISLARKNPARPSFLIDASPQGGNSFSDSVLTEGQVMNDTANNIAISLNSINLAPRDGDSNELNDSLELTIRRGNPERNNQRFNLRIRVINTDKSSQRISDAEVRIEAIDNNNFAPQSTNTSRGRAKFKDLEASNYKITITKAGFSTLEENLLIQRSNATGGRNVNKTFRLKEDINNQPDPGNISQIVSIDSDAITNVDKVLAISGERIAWMQGLNNNDDELGVFTMNLQDRQIRQILTSPEAFDPKREFILSRSKLSMDANKIVFNCPGTADNSSVDGTVCVFDFSNNQLSFPNITGGFPRISGNTVISSLFGAQRNGSGTFTTRPVFFDLNQSTEATVIAPTEFLLSRNILPEIDGDTVCTIESRQENENTNLTDKHGVFVYDIKNPLSSGTQISDLTNRTGSRLLVPEVSGNNIVFLDDDDNNQDFKYAMFLYDLNTNTKTQIASEVACCPDIDGNYITWSGFVPNSASEQNIFYYDIAKGSTTQITNDDGNNNGRSMPRISGKKIVWIEDSNIRLAPGIYLFEIP